MSDCGGVFWLQHEHHYTDNETETCHVVLDAELDVECGGEEILPNNLADAGLRVLMRLKHFEEATRPYIELVPSMVHSGPHQQLALDAARHGIVLLKNAPNTAGPSSPSNRHRRLRRRATIGPFGFGGDSFLAIYHGWSSFIKEPYDEIKKYVSDLAYKRGCGVTDFDDSGLQAA